MKLFSADEEERSSPKRRYGLEGPRRA
ncbi:hypothetical protein DSM3645_03928 [Blastopirellula marina DSM 3645]|uniref:Uncharacterized protein n=1 Tax=Blastopirellula marina DSM 3645 TaxID=314230 RepID=A3ZV57_9BACT|nr:hypothetical protein DSM3645_03928 [Blastopirellula marina DSM 3645]